MFRRSITFPQMAVAMCLGTAGGVYIYGPYYRRQDQAPVGAGALPPPGTGAEGVGAGPERQPEPQSKDGVE